MMKGNNDLYSVKEKRRSIYAKKNSATKLSRNCPPWFRLTQNFQVRALYYFGVSSVVSGPPEQYQNLLSVVRPISRK